MLDLLRSHGAAFAPHSMASYIVLDIETADAPAESIEAAIAAWKAPGAWLPETVGKKRAEAEVRIRERAALLDTAPILCIGAISDSSRVIFHSMGAASPDIDGWRCLGSVDERGMLLTFREWLSAHSDDLTTLVGSNIRGWDAPKLRHAYARHRLRIPGALAPALGSAPAQEMVDIASLYKAFSAENRDNNYISLQTISRGLGLRVDPKTLINGADIPKLYREGHYSEILLYNCTDCVITQQAYLLMTSEDPGLG